MRLKTVERKQNVLTESTWRIMDRTIRDGYDWNVPPHEYRVNFPHDSRMAPIRIELNLLPIGDKLRANVN